MHSNEDALYIYFTRVGAENDGYTSVDFTQVELLDEHGCIFLPTQAGGDDDGRLVAMPGTPARPRMGSGYSVGWFRFEAFPRHESKFRLRVFTDETNQCAEFVVANPASPPVTAKWVTQPLPITNVIGDVSFSLTQLKVKTNVASHKYFGYYGNPIHLVPKYEISEAGQPSTNWEGLDAELYDSSGNFASAMYGDLGYLSPREAAWKLRVKFFGSEFSHAASNATWTLPGLVVPEHGKFVLLQSARGIFKGVPIKAIAFAGVGDFVYSNNLPTAIDAADVPQGESSLKTSWNNNRAGVSSEIHTVHGLIPHLLLEVGHLNDDQRITIRATDEQGRNYYAYEWHAYGNNPPPKEKPDKILYLDKRYGQPTATVSHTFLGLNLPAEVKTVDVTICVHAGTIAEFIFPAAGAR